MDKCFENVRKKQPLVHCITNFVTMNDVANMILASGARPIMSFAPQDVEEVTAGCEGLTINTGTINEISIAGMHIAGGKAQQMNHPILLDPVGVGASTYRKETVSGLLDEIHFTVIRGNISEIRVLAGGCGRTSGVDAREEDKVNKDNLEEVIDFLRRYAGRMNSIIAVTGEKDIVTDGRETYVIYNGTKEMSSVTGTGCQLSGLITAFISANRGNELKATAAAIALMGLAGETAMKYMQEGDGNATYRNRIIDAVYNMTPQQLKEGAKYEKY